MKKKSALVAALLLFFYPYSAYSLFTFFNKKNEERKPLNRKIKRKALFPLEDLNIVIPNEMVVNITMELLPSRIALTKLTIDEAANKLLKKIKKIVFTLGTGNFSPRSGKLFTLLVNRIKERVYPLPILRKAIEKIADNSGVESTSIGLALIKIAGLPTELFYSNMGSRNNDWKSFLELLKKLKQNAKIVINLSKMPFVDVSSRYNNTFNNPLVYLFDLYAKNSAIDEYRRYYKNAIDYFISWAHETGYLKNLLMVHDDVVFNDLVQLFIANDMDKQILDKIKNYDKELYRKLNQELLKQYGYSVD